MLVAAGMFFALLLYGADFLADGMKALEERRFQEAADLFSKAVAADPSDYAAHFHLALAQSMTGKDAEAVASYKKVLELKPGLYEAELNLGIILAAQKRGVEAVSHLQSAAEKKPAEFRPRFYLAEALFQAGDWAKAEASYSQAAQLDPKSAAAELGLARCEERQNRLEAAPHFRKAAELDPRFQDALLELAALYERNKQTADAISIYEQFPGNIAAEEHLGALLIEARRYQEAIQRLEKVTAQDPTAANRLALANAYRFNKQPEKALPLLEQVVAADPGNYELHMLYGTVLRDQKQYAPAARQFYLAAQRQPNSKEAWSEMAGMLTLLENYPQALAALDRVKTLGGETPGHLFFRAIILDKTKQLKPALEAYQQFLASAAGKFPDEEFQARQRVRIIQKELSKR